MISKPRILSRIGTIARFLCLCTALLLIAAGTAHALSLNGLRVGLQEQRTRIAVDLDRPSAFRAFITSDPWRLVIDMPEFTWNVGAISNAPASLVSSIRQGPLQPGFSRVIIDLTGPAMIQTTFTLAAQKSQPARLVIDLARTTPETFAAKGKKIYGPLDVPGTPAGPVAASAASQPPPQPQRKPDTPKPAVKPLIVIDAGHGGDDPGAKGANGMFEKQVTLAMAKELKKQLLESGNYRVRMTRERDVYLRLFERRQIARDVNADFFISLHADSVSRSGVRGASVYTLSEKASDAETAKLAERENFADAIAGVDLSDEDEMVANILVDLARRDTMNQSNFYANTIVDTLRINGINILENPHRSAGFAVLKSPDVPSILLEMGFMSNKADARQLFDPAHQQKMAAAIARSLDIYFGKIQAVRNN